MKMLTPRNMTPHAMGGAGPLRPDQLCYTSVRVRLHLSVVLIIASYVTPQSYIQRAFIPALTHPAINPIVFQNAMLDDSCRQKDDQLSRLEQDYGDQIGQLTEERRVLRNNYDEKLKEYEQLLDLKLQLDHEIATYRALLQEEENRLVLLLLPAVQSGLCCEYITCNGPLLGILTEPCFRITCYYQNNYL